ncbi:MAG TPA: shikimate kinase [Acidimicrobiia bacterium]|jgi:adenylate kinase family enzyme
MTSDGTGSLRVSVIGTSGSGKSTFGKRLAERIGAEYVELDSIFHQANWTPLADDEFQERVRARTAGERWVVDGNYGVVRPIVLERATTVVWLDYPRPLVMARVIRRSVARGVTRRELWNGNKEDPREWIRADHPIRWAWSQHGRKRIEYTARFAEPQYERLDVHRFHHPRDAARWLASIG